MSKVTQSTSVPKTMQARYDQIVALTDEFCQQHLNDEYRDLARAMAASGQAWSWACGIVYALGQVNFLSDKATQPYMTMADVCAAFSVSPSTGGAKARTISDALKLRPFDPDWTLPSMMDRNPLVWMTEVNGYLVDLRSAPREVQEIAFEKGMIPYIPDDRG